MVPSVAPSPKAAVIKSPSIMRSLKHIVLDGWTNIMGGLGSIGLDKRLGASINYSRMSEVDAERLYAASDIAQTVVEAVPHDCARQWFTFTSDVDGLGADIDSYLDARAVAANLIEGHISARIYGGAAVLMNVDDSRTLDQPLDKMAVRELKSLAVLTRYELYPDEIDTDLTSVRFGKPVYYRFNPSRATSGDNFTRIHHSRLLIFDGAHLPLRLWQQNNCWHDSILNKMQNWIRNYDTANDAVATVLQEFNQGVFKIKGLGNMLMNNQDELIQKRMTTIQMARGICRAAVIDSDSEEFINVGANVTGIPEMVKTTESRLATAAKMPRTKLFGVSPSGLGASGESEENDWDDFISNEQEIAWRPKIQILLEIILNSRKGPTGGKVPKSWHFEFNPLKQQTEKETMAIRKDQADVDDKYVAMGAVDPREIRASRFGSGKYSHETVIETQYDKDLDEPEDLEADPIVKDKTEGNA